MDCLFCKIANKEIQGDIVFENDSVIAFRDITPRAPVHVLIIPKTHISSALEIDSNSAAVVSEIFIAAAQIAKNEGVAERGYRIVTNIGEDGGQTVKHLHYHLIGGRQLELRFG